MTRVHRLGLVLAALLAATAVVVPVALAAQEAPLNLQYFDEGTSRDSVVEVMRQFSFALGVRCQYCHIGGDGVSFEGVVFESDEDPDKRKARYMLEMVDELNQTLLAAMPDRDDPASMISCKTCHRGAPKPALLSDMVLAALDAGGAEAAVSRYRDLRENESLAGRYDFGEWETNTLAERLTGEGRFSDAITIYELNLEFFPESVAILASLGQLHERIEDVESAMGYYERILELRPGDRRAQSRLDALRGAAPQR